MLLRRPLEENEDLKILQLLGNLLGGEAWGTTQLQGHCKNHGKISDLILSLLDLH